MVKEVTEVEEKTKELGITQEEYAFLNTAKKHDSAISDQELVSFVKELSKRIKSKAFVGWQKNRGVVKDVEQVVFDSCFEKFSQKMKTQEIASLTDELMKFVTKYNA